MGWMQDRDLLIAETLEFVKQVKGAQAETTEAPTEQTLPIEEIKAPEKASELEPPKFERLSSFPRRNEREEIASRLASFKATQLKFQREREHYGSTTLKDALDGRRTLSPSVAWSRSG
jgi:hypothetical protein